MQTRSNTSDMLCQLAGEVTVEEILKLNTVQLSQKCQVSSREVFHYIYLVGGYTWTSIMLNVKVYSSPLSSPNKNNSNFNLNLVKLQCGVYKNLSFMIFLINFYGSL